MNASQWTSLKKQPDKAKKMLSALHMSPAYLKVSWNELDEGDQKKVSKWVSKNGSGWFETAQPTPTSTGIRNVAPKHYNVATTKSIEGILKQPMEKEKPASVRTDIREDVKKETDISEQPPKEKECTYNDETAIQFQQQIDSATDIKSIGTVLSGLQTSSLSDATKHDLETYAKEKYGELFQAQQRSHSDLTLINEFKSRIEFTEDIDLLNEIAVDIVDNVANGNFAKAQVISKDINDLHERIDDKITRIYNQKIGTTDDFAQKAPVNLIVISTEMNRLRELNKKIQASSLNQTRKDNLEIRIHSKINEISKLKPKPEVKSLDDFGKLDYDSLKSKTDYILIQISEFTTKAQIDAFGSQLKVLTDTIGSTDDPKVQEMIDNIVRLYNVKRRQLYGDTPTKVIRTADEYEIRNLEYEAKNKPAEMLPSKSYDDVSQYIWGITEQEAINKYVGRERKKLQSNIDYVAKSRAELVEMVKTKPHILLTKAEINKRYPEKAEEYIRDLWNYKSLKSTYEKNADSARFWQSKVDKIDSGEWAKLNANYLREAYLKEVKDAIKNGKPVPFDVIKQYPEFTKSQNNRERYDKGRHTSFANVSIAVDTRHQENHGIKIKLQDGTPMEDKYADDIVHLLSMYQSVIGSITPIFKQEDVTISHTKGKHPFLSTAAGCYSPIEKTVTLGRRGVGSHELSHFLDETAKHRHKDEQLYDYALLAIAKKNMNGGVERAIELSKSKSPDELENARELRYRLGGYWKRPEELFARLMEQYTAFKTKGQNITYLHYPYDEYVKTPAYWDDVTFTSMIPQIEAELNRKLKLAGD